MLMLTSTAIMVSLLVHAPDYYHSSIQLVWYRRLCVEVTLYQRGIECQPLVLKAPVTCVGMCWPLVLGMQAAGVESAGRRWLVSAAGGRCRPLLVGVSCRWLVSPVGVGCRWLVTAAGGWCQPPVVGVSRRWCWMCQQLVLNSVLLTQPVCSWY